LLPKYPTRGDFINGEGFDPLDGDPHQPLKGWADTGLTGSDDESVTYDVFSTDPNTHITTVGTITKTKGWARRPNLPGNHHWTSWIVMPAPKSGTAANGVFIAPIDPKLLSMREQGLMIVDAWGLDHSALSELQFPESSPLKYVYLDDSDPRRYFIITYNGSQYAVGYLLAEMYAQGVGAPGSWTFGPGKPTWVSGVIPQLPFTAGRVPVPIRKLAEGESIVNTGMAAQFGSVIIQRADKTPAASAPAAGGGSFGTVQANQLTHLVKTTDALYQAILQRDPNS
jgi:hypothetical protein